MYKVYQVQGGETIESIAQKLSISPTELINLNSLFDQVVPGQLLVIPNQDGMYENYIVQKGDNMYEIARKNNISLEDLLKINGLNKDDYIYPGQNILIPKDGYSIYITKEESLNDIANKLGLNPNDIINQNETLYLLPDQLIIYRS